MRRLSPSMIVTANALRFVLRKQGRGIFCSGVTGMTFLPLDTVTPKAVELYKAMRDMVAALDTKNTPPGLLEQYNMLLERYRPGNGSPGCEFFTFPGCTVGPPHPEPGKKYLTMFVVLNYLFSRGTVVSMLPCVQ